VLQCSFLIGLTLIVLATVHNVGFDGMSKAERLTLPSYLAETYDKTGKTGVTVFFVTLGMLVILTGFLLRHLWNRSHKKGGWVAPDHLAPSPVWSAKDSTTAPVGRVVLDTQKYMEWNEHSSMRRWETAES
jgi:hypothetical protein